MTSKWPMVRFEDVVHAYQPETLSVKELDAAGHFPVYGANGIIGQHSSYNHENSELTMTCRGATCGSLNVTLPQSWINGNAMVLSPKTSDLNRDYLRYALSGGVDVKSVITGAAQPQITRASLHTLSIPLPPLDEQKRIVAKLDEAMSDLNCVEKQTSEIGDLAALFTSAVLSEEFAVSSKWPIVPLSDLTTVLTDGDWVESKDQSPSGIRLLQTGNVGLGRFRANDNRARYISAETFERLNCTEVVAGDVLISRLPDPIGRACVIPELNERTITAVDCAVLRFKESIIPELFIYYSQSSDYLQTAEAKATGSTRQRISRSNLSQIQIPLPPLDEQKRIVAKLDEISECSSMRKDLQNRRTESIAKLKSVILAAAFAGNL